MTPPLSTPPRRAPEELEHAAAARLAEGVGGVKDGAGRPEGVVVVVDIPRIRLVVVGHRLAYRRGHGPHLGLPLEDGLEGVAVGQ